MAVDSIDNLRESAHRQLMVALAHSGQRSEALAQYDICRRLLQTELGVEPSPQLHALYERLARGEPLLGTPVMATPPERYRAWARKSAAALWALFIGPTIPC